VTSWISNARLEARIPGVGRGVIVSIEPKPFEELRYLNASRRGRAEVARLPFHRGRAELPAAWDALVVASDLQGIATPAWGEPAALLGVSVARKIDEMDLGRVIVVLAGDLYSVPEANKRGGFGDVSSVWDAFASVGEVMGVAGNHDDVSRVAHGTLLDGDVVDIDGVRFGGVGLVAGNDEKPGRRSEDVQLERLYDAMLSDVLVLHEGPHVDDDHEGSVAIMDALESSSMKLVICGHRPWSEPLVRIGRATQVLNVHERVVVLQNQ
jgi:Icc-related predicted phosphoesterase